MVKIKLQYVFSLLLILQGFDVLAQEITLSQNEEVTIKNQVSDLIDNYETGLNNLGDSRDGVREKEYFITDILQRVFEGKDVLVLNDLDPNNQESQLLKADVYLNNIIAKYSKGAVFNFSGINISKPFYLDDDQIFIKVALIRDLKGIHISEEIDNKQHLDIYVSLKADEGNIVSFPKIYSITQHQNNLNDFTPVKIDHDGVDSPLAVTLPDNNSVLVRGKVYPVKWEGSGEADSLKIELYRNDEYNSRINEVVLGNIFYWKVPKLAPPGDDYQIKVSIINGTAKSTMSEEFTIRRKVPLVFKIVPMAGVAAAAIYLFTSGSEAGNGSLGLPLPPDPPD